MCVADPADIAKATGLKIGNVSILAKEGTRDRAITLAKIVESRR